MEENIQKGGGSKNMEAKAGPGRLDFYSIRCNGPLKGFEQGRDKLICNKMEAWWGKNGGNP